MLNPTGREICRNVMAGFIPAIHAFLAGAKDVDARHKAGHDEL
jgi:hypothetical protein